MFERSMFLNESDQHLINKALGGSQKAWIKLVRRYESRIYNACLRMSGSPHDAFDLMQDVFLAIYRNLPNFRGDSQFITWCFRIAANKSTDWLRSRHRTPTSGAENFQPDHQISHETPHGEMQKHQVSQQILHSLAQLPAEQRLVIELKFFQHFTFEDIAKQIGISSNTVKTRLYTALKKLKGHLEVQNVM